MIARFEIMLKKSKLLQRILKLVRRVFVKDLSKRSVDFYEQVSNCQITNLSYLYSLFIGDKSNGYFVDVGAYDGRSISNTWGLARRGWRGIMIEPVHEFAEKCRRNHQENSGVTVIECAVGSRDNSIIQLSFADTLTTGNSVLLSEYERLDWSKHAITKRKLQVESRTLDSILNEYLAPVNFDVLSIDVEGFESEVLVGFNLRKWQPKMLVIELVETHPDLESIRHESADIFRQILDAGYFVVYKDHINTIFVQKVIWEGVLRSE
jgi:FkbM family methyltransferase